MNAQPAVLIRRLGRRYGAVLAVVAALLIVDQAVLQPILVRLNLSAPVINLAGRQRMLSQRMVKSALAIARSPEDGERWQPELDESFRDWKRVHAGLQSGDESLHLTPTRSPVIRRAFSEIEPHVAALSSGIETVLSDPAAAALPIPELLANEQPYLRGMDRIVRLYEADAQGQVQRLRWISGLGTAAIVAMMAGLYWLVLRPATSLIRSQVDQLSAHEQELSAARDELELRVLERTRQLSETNAALADQVREREQAEQKTLQLQSQLAQAARVTSLGQLATGIAHEVNQPLGAITNYAETLLILADQDSPNRAVLSSTARRLRDAAIRAGQIIRRMRNFVRSRSETRAVERVTPLIEDVLALCEPDLRQRQTRVELRFETDWEAFIHVDAIQIQQVLVNLIRNAAQAMESLNPDRRRLTIQTRSDGEDVVIDVEDGGPGFPAEALHPVAPLTSTKPDGMGLGLSISQSIIAGHGGTLRSENLSPCGARVRITLPTVKAPTHRSVADRLCC